MTIDDDMHESFGAMLFRGLEEARAYARTPDGEAQLCRKLNEMADDWQACGSVEYPPVLRLAAERISELNRERDEAFQDGIFSTFEQRAKDLQEIEDRTRREENEACAKVANLCGSWGVAGLIRARMEEKY